GDKRMQPWDAAVPSRPDSPFVPCRAIWPGPPSNSCRTLDRALVASANGPPCAAGESESASSTKNRPRGVGVDEAPTMARKRRETRPAWDAVTRRAERSTARCQPVDDADVCPARIQPV